MVIPSLPNVMRTISSLHDPQGHISRSNYTICPRMLIRTGFGGLVIPGHLKKQMFTKLIDLFISNLYKTTEITPFQPETGAYHQH